MTEKILSALERLHMETWRINISRKESAELFFVRRNADMTRATDVSETHLTVFHDFEDGGVKMRGMSQISIYPGMSDAEMDKAILEAYENASHVKNKWFELPDPVKDECESKKGGEGLAQMARKMADAIFAADTLGKAFVNSVEVFAEEEHVRVLASNGLDVRYTKQNFNGEFVVQCIDGQDVELHRSFSYSKPDAQALQKEVEEALHTVQDRANATQAPVAGEYDCVLSGKQVARLLDGYVFKANASWIYARYSGYQVGSGVQGENVQGEKLNITLTSSEPYSEEGVPMPEMELVRDGVLQNIHGPARMCRYLDVQPAGPYRSAKLSNGTMPMAAMLKARCIHPVAFSDFQMDPFTGHFGGEIRLAYVYDENGVHTVTGGSINGSLLDKQGNMVFSLERYSTGEYDGPMAVLLRNVSVAGRE